MAIPGGSIIEVVMNMRYLNMEVLNVWQYGLTVPGLEEPAIGLAEGWWNHVKATYRALAQTGDGEVFRSVRVTNLSDPLGDYAEFDVPPAEQTGTRTVGTNPDRMPPYTSVGVRLTVGSRITRPGQKRFPFIAENDQSAGVLGVTLRNLIIAHMVVMTGTMVLGAPVALSSLLPLVVRKIPSGGVSAYQPVTGFLVNGNLTTQNSRKFGRGS